MFGPVGWGQVATQILAILMISWGASQVGWEWELSPHALLYTSNFHVSEGRSTPILSTINAQLSVQWKKIYLNICSTRIHLVGWGDIPTTHLQPNNPLKTRVSCISLSMPILPPAINVTTAVPAKTFSSIVAKTSFEHTSEEQTGITLLNKQNIYASYL